MADEGRHTDTPGAPQPETSRPPTASRKLAALLGSALGGHFVQGASAVVAAVLAAAVGAWVTIALQRPPGNAHQLTAPAPSGTPATTRTPTVATAVPVVASDYVCAGGLACIKANISGANRIYHFPGCPSYKQTHIDTSKGERFFASAREAEDAGFRRAHTCPR